jgi:hypothetical protein
MKQLSKSWNFMSEEQKARYNLMSKKDRLRFEAQRQRHKQCITSGQPCTCKLTEAAEQSKIRSMVGIDAPILALQIPANGPTTTVKSASGDEAKVIYVAPV